MKRVPGAVTVAALACVCAGAYMSLGCANVNAPVSTGRAGRRRRGRPEASAAAASVGFGGSAQAGTCVNLQCQQDNCTRGACTQTTPCPNGAKTTVSGIVYDPAGKTPLYNVVVYVPNEPLAEIATGASLRHLFVAVFGAADRRGADRCGRALLLEHMPVGDDIPLVIQIGKWRRAVTIPSVAACADTPVADAADAPAAQQGRGTHPEDRDRDRRRPTRSNACSRRSASTTPSSRSESSAGRVNQYAGLRRARDQRGRFGGDLRRRRCGAAPPR